MNMRTRRRTITALALLAVSAGAALAQTNGEAKKTIRAADAAWLRAYAAKDVDNAVASLDDQGSMLPPNAPIATGRDAVRTAIATAFAVPGYNLVWHIAKLDIAASGDLGYTSGPYEFTYKDASGKTIFVRSLVPDWPNAHSLLRWVRGFPFPSARAPSPSTGVARQTQLG